MAVSGTVPSRKVPGFDPPQLARRLRRVTWLAAAIATVVFLCWYGAERVPRGMNTIPGIPPGSLCLVDRRASAAKVGSDVFCDVPDLGLVLSRITAVDADTITIEHPNPQAAWPDSRAFGPLPKRALRSTVLVVFAPEGAADGAPRGR